MSSLPIGVTYTKMSFAVETLTHVKARIGRCVHLLLKLPFHLLEGVYWPTQGGRAPHDFSLAWLEAA
jgi:hypothetical protein